MRPLNFFALSLLFLATPALADVYKCADGRGKVQYQNVPCADGAAPVFETVSPSVLVPRVLPRDAAASAVPLSVPAVPAVPPAVAPVVSKTRSSVPVDTRQFGLLAMGASERSVINKLGEPGEIIEDVLTLVGGRVRGGRIELREKRRSLWVYQGDGQIMTTVLTFEDGVLVNKEKRPW